MVPTGETNQIGFIAQDVEQFMPKSLVTRDIFGLEDCKLLYMVSYAIENDITRYDRTWKFV